MLSTKAGAAIRDIIFIIVPSLLCRSQSRSYLIISHNAHCKCVTFCLMFYLFVCSDKSWGEGGGCMCMYIMCVNYHTFCIIVVFILCYQFTLCAHHKDIADHTPFPH